MLQSTLFLLTVLGFAASQTCDNFAATRGNTCLCPPGFGGDSCAQSSCGGNVFQGRLRESAPPVDSNSLSNLTASNCDSQCSILWTGTGCSVCKHPTSCSSGFRASGGVPNIILPGVGDGQNNTLSCNTSPRVYSSGTLSCQKVDSPTLQQSFTGEKAFTMMRTVEPALSVLNNGTALGGQNTVLAQFFYDGVEQWFCKADSCAQTLVDESTGNSNWACQNLQCKCREKATMCGGGSGSGSSGNGTTDLTGAINALSGSVSIDCEAGPENNGTAGGKCKFKTGSLDNAFSASELSLSECSFGECIAQAVIDANGSVSVSSSNPNSGIRSTSFGEVVQLAGLAILGGLFHLALS